VPARSGLWQYWYENGGRRLAGCFEHGHQVGTWTEWSERGEARTVATYPSARQECKTQTEETAR
jgi:antitoxin component YwqK of YwqJK toxin-antitoxin module